MDDDPPESPLPAAQNPPAPPATTSESPLPAPAVEGTRDLSGLSQFVYITCQLGAERAVKNELARRWPNFRFAFSRPGLLTFRMPETEPGWQLDEDLQSVFARCYGLTLERVKCATAEELRDALARWHEQLTTRFQLTCQQLHLWQRDGLERAPDGEPHWGALPTAYAGELAASPTGLPAPPNQRALPDQRILDAIRIDEGQWLLGLRSGRQASNRWVGGIPVITRPPRMISRAYLKAVEALWWSRLPIQRGDLCAELGSAPGGAAQAFLERGLRVLGIDPAEMDPEILAHPGFTHLRKRGSEVKRRDLRDVTWLFADSNVAPKHTLDAVESLVTHRHVQVRGVLLTLKLLDWKLADALPEYVARIREWGFQYVQARQLAHNRSEVCVLGLRSRAQRRRPRQKRAAENPAPTTITSSPATEFPTTQLPTTELPTTEPPATEPPANASDRVDTQLPEAPPQRDDQ